jgi:hypothetical protein
MSIVTYLDHQMTMRQQQEFDVMMLLEDAISGSEPINTSDLAKLIVAAVENVDPAAFEDA